MPDRFVEVVDAAKQSGVFHYMIIVFVSAWAGTVRYFQTIKNKKPRFFPWLMESSISGFTRLITGLLCDYAGLNYYLTLAVVGIMAHNSAKTLQFFSDLAIEKIKKNAIK